MMPLTLDATQIIQRPLITEKGTELAEKLNCYLFRVHPRATKPDIRAAVEKLYDVRVVDVRTLNRKGKQRRTKTGHTNTGDWKRAIVKLEEGSRIDLF
jgi:large subunit ribosomal protein L23